MTILKIPEVNEGSAIQNDANGQKLMKKKNGRKKSSKDTTSTAPTPAEMTNNDFSLEVFVALYRFSELLLIESA